MASDTLNIREHNARRRGRRRRFGDRGYLTVAVLLCLAGCAAHPSDAPPATVPVTIGGKQFTLELATDNTQRFRGLSDRKEIAADGGMLFAFPEPSRLTFVMRKCYVPIDLIYVGQTGMIVAMHRMTVEPYDTPEQNLTQYPSGGWQAQFAIELKGGSIDQLGLVPWQKLDLPLEALKRWAK